MVDKEIAISDTLSIASKIEILDQVFAQVPIALAIIDPTQKKILWTSKYTQKLFNSGDGDYHAHIWKELFRNDEMHEDIMHQLECEGIVKNLERAFLNESGEMFVALIDFNFIELNGKELILADILDITERKQNEADVSHEAEAEKLLSNITRQLLDVNSEDATYNSLKNLGVYFEIDTIIIQETPHIGIRPTSPFYWSASNEIIDVNRLIGETLSTYPWFEKQLVAGKKVILSSAEDLPKDAYAEQQMMKQNDIKSLMIHPILYHRNLVGMIIVESQLRFRKWTLRESSILSQYSSAIGFQIVSRQSAEILRAAKIRAEKALGELEGAQDQLIRMEKMASLGDMVAGIAHETNTPLGIAVTTTSTLRAKSNQLKAKLEEGQMKKSDLVEYFDISKEGYQILENNLQRAAELIRSFKRVAVDVTSNSIQTIEVGKYMDDILLNIRPRTKKFKKIIISVDCPIELETQTDPGALAQIITNLTLNSLIHAFDDNTSAVGKISIVASRVSDNLIITFKDDGKGINDEIKSKIFEPYFTTKRGEGGSGLGMSIICDLVEKTLRGSISVESTLGEGTQFTMLFPMNYNNLTDKV